MPLLYCCIRACPTLTVRYDVPLELLFEVAHNTPKFTPTRNPATISSSLVRVTSIILPLDWLNAIVLLYLLQCRLPSINVGHLIRLIDPKEKTDVGVIEKAFCELWKRNRYNIRNIRTYSHSRTL